MLYQNVCLEAFGYTLPAEAVSSAELEARLKPLYERLRLPEGRLELMTGIRERRFWPPGALPSENSSRSAERALVASGIDRTLIGALVHSSVCRDYLEPATACVVHSKLGLPDECLLYDCSNACLGFMNGLCQVANMIELGQIRAGVVVATEGSRELVENTIQRLNADLTLTRESVKLAMASLTIGSASVAAVLCDKELSQTQNRLAGGICHTDTRGAGLCHSGRDEAVAGGMTPWMQTDAENLMHAGIAVGVRAFERLLRELSWQRKQLDKTICHQVGVMHRKLMFKSLNLEPARDFATLEFLGNTGSVALPITAAIAAERGFLQPNDKVAWLGIGSGINCLMLGIDWQTTPVAGGQAPAATVPSSLVEASR